MQTPPVRISEVGSKAGIGVFLGIAITLAVGRTYIRIIQARKITVDDGFFFAAILTLSAGTAACYVHIPYLYQHKNFTPGTTMITPELIQVLLRSVKIQTAIYFLFSMTLSLVKLSFLFFFRGLLRRLRGLTIWWWCVLTVTVPLNILLISCTFIACPPYDAITLAFIDIFTDFLSKKPFPPPSPNVPLTHRPSSLVISIPIALLWRVRISLRRKLILGGTLSLSIFTMIVSVVRIAGGMRGGTFDLAWVNFWLQVEAAVAVMIVLITAYRSLFVMGKASGGGKSPKERLSTMAYRRRLWIRGRQRGHDLQLPTLPDPALTGMRTVIGRAGGMTSEEEVLERGERSVHGEINLTHSGEEARVHHGHDFV